jgi:hypothetical protein
MNLLRVSSTFALLLLLGDFSHLILALPASITQSNNNNLKMSAENSFLFTSESVNEGHPGTYCSPSLLSKESHHWSMEESILSFSSLHSMLIFLFFLLFPLF